MTYEINTPNGPALETIHGDILISSIFDYDNDNHSLIWKKRPEDWFNSVQSWRTWNARFAGKTINGRGYKGYFFACVFYKRIGVHRIIFAFHNNVWPINNVDHIDGNGKNNNPLNLRDVTQAENLRNTAISKKNKSGSPGIFWRADYNKWSVSIGRKVYIGSFSSFEDAVVARKKAEAELGYHNNHGRRHFAVTEPN